MQKVSASKRVLIVDDNVDAAESLGMLLDLIGHRVCTIHVGGAALQGAREFEPDVVILDISLPGMSGYQVAAALRNEPAFRNTVLIAMTGWSGEEDRRIAQEAGFDFYLTKPVDAEKISRLLGQPRPTGEESCAQ